MPGWMCWAVDSPAAIRKRTSGSRVLFSGVGTQMIAASQRFQRGVVRGRREGGQDAGEAFRGDVLDIGFAPLQRSHLARDPRRSRQPGIPARQRPRPAAGPRNRGRPRRPRPCAPGSSATTGLSSAPPVEICVENLRMRPCSAALQPVDRRSGRRVSGPPERWARLTGASRTMRRSPEQGQRAAATTERLRLYGTLRPGQRKAAPGRVAPPVGRLWVRDVTGCATTGWHSQCWGDEKDVADAPGPTRTGTSIWTQALNLPCMPIPPRGHLVRGIIARFPALSNKSPSSPQTARILAPRRGAVKSSCHYPVHARTCAQR